MDAILKKPIKDCMTKTVVSVKGEESIKNVFKLMEKHDIVGLPVVDDHDAVVGILTQSDLIKHFTTLKTPIAVSILGSIVYLDSLQDWSQHLKEHTAELVKDIMNSDVVVIIETQTLQEAIDLMANRGVNRLPVIDEHGKLTGILTRRDIVHQLAKLSTI